MKKKLFKAAGLLKQNLIREIKIKNKYDMYDGFIKETFDNDEIPLDRKCDSLFQYIMSAFLYYSGGDYTHVYYPGYPGSQGAKKNAMEGVSRFLPTIAAWRHFSNTNSFKSLDGNMIDISEVLHQSFIKGTNKTSPSYWGDIDGDSDHRICEAADLALALWISKDYVWVRYTITEKKQISDWFNQCLRYKVIDNNWLFFPLTIQFVLKSLTGNDQINIKYYQRIKEFYNDDGWFKDGIDGGYDYYNAWGFYYSLYWLSVIEPDFDKEFISAAIDKFNAGFQYFIGPSGVPLFGRSLCYRLAVTAPLIAGASIGNRPCSIGQIKRSLSCSLSYYIKNGALQNGIPTQGIFATDERLLDDYSGPGSSLWSLRALNIAFFSGHNIGLWDAEEQLLPVEIGDYIIEIEDVGLCIIGVNKTKEIIVIHKKDSGRQHDYLPPDRKLESISLLARCIQRILGVSMRKSEGLLEKGITSFSSKLNGLL